MAPQGSCLQEGGDVAFCCWLDCEGAILKSLIILLLLCSFLIGCTQDQRADCYVCEKTGLCRLMGDDPNLAKSRHPEWFGLEESFAISPAPPRP